MKVNWIMSGVSSEGFNWVESERERRLEVVLGQANFKQVWWLEKAVEAAKKVARVKFPNGSATGSLIGEDLFLTNNHVFENEADARNAVIQFNYRLLADGERDEVDEWECDPDTLFKTSADLDYSIVKLKKKNNENPGNLYGFFNLRQEISLRVNNRVNIIQHPQGRFQEIAFRDNQVKAVEDTFIQYLTDTDYGSSGSPVLDDYFNLVALHNQRVPDPDEPYRWYRNQGFRVEAIVNDANDIIP